MKKPYYHAYEERYQKVFAAGVERWGHRPDDPELVETLANWVRENNLTGKRVIEFGCGEGGAGEILSELGCVYHGVDISPTGAARAQKALEGYPNATVSILDMVNQKIAGKYDAALDVMAFHMLVLDSDREKYLANVFECLKSGAPMLFYRELYEKDAYEGEIGSFEQWIAVSGSDYETPGMRTAEGVDGDIKVSIPLVPGRAKTENGYRAELKKAGFSVEQFTELGFNYQCPYSAAIYVSKP